MKLSLLTSALLLAGYAAAAPFHTTSTHLAPLYTSTESEIVPESYIVVLKDHVKEQKIMEHCGWVASLHDDDPLASSLLDPTVAAGIKHTFNLPTVSGYTGRFSDRTLERIRQSPDVSFFLYPFAPSCFRPGIKPIITLNRLHMLSVTQLFMHLNFREMLHGDWPVSPTGSH